MHLDTSLLVLTCSTIVCWCPRYVPPFWLHHVETLEDSVSVNVWSDSRQYSTMDAIYRVPIPVMSLILHCSELSLLQLPRHILVSVCIGVVSLCSGRLTWWFLHMLR